MIAPTKLEQQADGTWKRVPSNIEEIIASKEDQLLEMYKELEALKASK